MTSAASVAPDTDALLRELTPGAFSAAGGTISGSSQPLTASDSSRAACGVLLATVTAGFGSCELQRRCLHTVLTAAAAAGGAAV